MQERDTCATPSRRPSDQLRFLNRHAARAATALARGLTALRVRARAASADVLSACRSGAGIVNLVSRRARRSAEIPAAEIFEPRNPLAGRRGHAAELGQELSWAWGAMLHELRVPLSGARFALERLDRKAVCQQDMAFVADSVHTALLGVVEAQCIVRWFSQLRMFERQGFRLEIVPLSVAEAIQRALALLVGAQGRFVVTCAEDVRPVAADRVWLTQTFANLFENAIKYGRDADVTRVNVTDPHDDDHIVVSVRTPGDPDAPLHVRAMMGRGGERQQRSDDLTSQGLGMKLVQFFVANMGGDVWVESEAGGDTRFVLSLPVAFEHPGLPH